MKKKANPIEELNRELILQLMQHQYSPNTIQLYKEHLNRIKNFMISLNKKFYTPELGENFILETISKKNMLFLQCVFLEL